MLTFDSTALTFDNVNVGFDWGNWVPSVVAPNIDSAGIALQTQIAAVQLLVALNANPLVLDRNWQLLNQLQVELVDHFMVTGWLNAAVILAAYQPRASDRTGQALATRVAFLQSLVNNAPPMPAGNADGYGSDGWTTVVAAYQQALYAKQIELVEHLMDTPGGTTAATMLAGLTGSQSFTFEYVFNSVGYTDAWTDG